MRASLRWRLLQQPFCRRATHAGCWAALVCPDRLTNLSSHCPVAGLQVRQLSAQSTGLHTPGAPESPVEQTLQRLPSGWQRAFELQQSACKKRAGGERGFRFSSVRECTAGWRPRRCCLLAAQDVF